MCLVICLAQFPITFFTTNFYSLSMFPLTDPINLTSQQNMTDPYDVHALFITPHTIHGPPYIFVFFNTSISILTHTPMFTSLNHHIITHSVDFNFLLSIYGCLL